MILERGKKTSEKEVGEVVLQVGLLAKETKEGSPLGSLEGPLGVYEGRLDGHSEGQDDGCKEGIEEGKAVGLDIG